MDQKDKGRQFPLRIKSVVCVCACACEHACVRACVCVHACVCAWACVHALFISSQGKFQPPYAGKAQQLQEHHYPFLSACAVFSCVQTMARMPAFGIFNMRMDADVCHCTWRLYGQHKRVCTGSGFLAAPGTQTTRKHRLKPCETCCLHTWAMGITFSQYFA